MSSFGDKLKHEREIRNKSLEDLASATGIGLKYLRALEHNEFERLPGRAFGKLYIRAYAEVFGFDPRPLIADYERERIDRERIVPPEAWHANPILVPPSAAAAVPEADAEIDEGDDEPAVEASPIVPTDALETRPVEDLLTDPASEPAPAEAPADSELAVPTPFLPETAPDEPLRRPWWMRARWWVPAVVGLLVMAGVRSVVVRGERAEAEPDPTVVTKDVAPAPIVQAPARITPPSAPIAAGEDGAVDTATAAAKPSAPAAPPLSVSSGGLAVSDYGIGRDRRLAVRDDRFVEGEVVWFSTRIVGGSRGDRVRHVWLRDGKAVQTVVLGVGASSWRTQSNKTLWGAGAWSVEARDQEGRVLARATFTCTPRSR
jgi:transcriptional regulator with XRE-family HTH domain